MVESVTKNMTPKAVRMSMVALSAAVMAVVWIVMDEVFDLYFSPVLVSSVTALVMLIAQWVDVKHKAAGDEVFDGDGDDD
jgi:hypothetical protein